MLFLIKLTIFSAFDFGVVVLFASAFTLEVQTQWHRKYQSSKFWLFFIVFQKGFFTDTRVFPFKKPRVLFECSSIELYCLV